MHGKTQIFLIKQDLKFYQKLKKTFFGAKPSISFGYRLPFLI